MPGPARNFRAAAGGIASVLLVSLPLAGCGILRTARHKHGLPSYVLTRSRIERIAEKTSAPAAVTAALTFYRNMQRKRYSAAYAELTPGLQRDIPFNRFKQAMAPAQGSVLLVPRLEDVNHVGALTTVRLLLQHGAILTQGDQRMTFTVGRQGARWVIADPGKALSANGSRQ